MTAKEGKGEKKFVIADLETRLKESLKTTNFPSVAEGVHHPC